MDSMSTTTIRGLLFAGFVLALGARYAVRSAMPSAPRGRHRRRRGSPRLGRPPRRTVSRPNPIPVSGGATGLLESIPFLEPVRRRSRFSGTTRLLMAIAAAAWLVAAVLFIAGRGFAAWLESMNF